MSTRCARPTARFNRLIVEQNVCLAELIDLLDEARTDADDDADDEPEAAQ
jgi:hypothetical protein